MSAKQKSRRAEACAASYLPVLPELRVTKHRPTKTFEPMNRSQESYLNKISNNTVTFSIGPAGTGKTFIAAMAAAAAFQNKEVEKIIISRPVVEAGEQLGFLPGDMNEKFTPYVAPFIEALSRIMGTAHVQALIEHEKIIFLPLAYMRGHSWDNAFVVLDEAQNVTVSQMKLFLTRIGKGTTVIVDGDVSQKDVEAFGLDDALDRLANVRGIAIQRFSEDDIVRSGIVKDIIKAYSHPSYKAPASKEGEEMEGVLRFLDK